MRVRPLAALLVGLAAPPAYADAARDVLVEVAKCADIADAAERLKCFDAAVARVKSALAAPQPEQPAPSKSILDWFGFSRPTPVTKTEDFGKPPAPQPEEEIQQISATVIEYAKTPRGKAVFILDNGQVWRQLDADTSVILDPDPAKPMKVKIERGVLTSYNLTIEGRNGLIKVSRVK